MTYGFRHCKVIFFFPSKNMKSSLAFYSVGPTLGEDQNFQWETSCYLVICYGSYVKVLCIHLQSSRKCVIYWEMKLSLKDALKCCKKFFSLCVYLWEYLLCRPSPRPYIPCWWFWPEFCAKYLLKRRKYPLLVKTGLGLHKFSENLISTSEILDARIVTRSMLRTAGPHTLDATV
jgi:hypothetical protein